MKPVTVVPDETLLPDRTWPTAIWPVVAVVIVSIVPAVPAVPLSMRPVIDGCETLKVYVGLAAVEIVVFAGMPDPPMY